LYEITTDDYSDTVPDGQNGTTSIPVSAQVECRRMAFQSPDEIKELVRADISFSDIYGSVSWALDFTPDYYPSYFPIQSGTIDFDTQTNELDSCSPPDLGLGYRTIRTVKPSDSCVIGVSRKARFGYLFQPRVSWIGYAKLAIFKFHASKKDISDLGEC
jgi:hypothetical protein